MPGLIVWFFLLGNVIRDPLHRHQCNAGAAMLPRVRLVLAGGRR
jgi:hypothetical protein